MRTSPMYEIMMQVIPSEMRVPNINPNVDPLMPYAISISSQ
jgi:hypothetical protein